MNNQTELLKITWLQRIEQTGECQQVDSARGRDSGEMRGAWTWVVAVTMAAG